MERLISGYHVEDHVSMGDIPIDAHGQLLHLLLAPAFRVAHRFLFGEIMRHTGMTVIYYRLGESQYETVVEFSYRQKSCWETKKN